jgi:hypothetical protein
VVERERREQRRLAVLLRQQDEDLGDAGEEAGEDQPLERLELERLAVVEDDEPPAELGEVLERADLELLLRRRGRRRDGGERRQRGSAQREQRRARGCAHG